MEDKIQISVAIGMILNKEGKILLQKRVDPFIPAADGKWEFPGGKIKFGESPEDAVKRECLEEVGCQVSIKRMLPQLQSALWERADNKTQQVFISCFEAEYLDGLPRPLDKKVSEVGWFSKEEISGMDTLRGIREFIDLLQTHES